MHIKYALVGFNAVMYNVYYLHFSCSAALCSDPPVIMNGMRTFDGNSVGDTATYSCDTGFELIGDSTTMCTQIDANFAEFPAVPPPECRREYCMNITACLLS